VQKDLGQAPQVEQKWCQAEKLALQASLNSQELRELREPQDL
jgi:hypothetical protein